jgi:hypothetical protein
MNLNKNIIQSGINDLIKENEELFKQNLIYVLTNKLNETVNNLEHDVKKILLKPKKQDTLVTENIEQFIEFINSYKNHKEHRLMLKNKAVINITESEIMSLKILFESLNAKNREKMAKSIFENAENLKNHVEFYSKVKGLI